MNLENLYKVFRFLSPIAAYLTTTLMNQKNHVILVKCFFSHNLEKKLSDLRVSVRCLKYWKKRCT